MSPVDCNSTVKAKNNRVSPDISHCATMQSTVAESRALYINPSHRGETKRRIILSADIGAIESHTDPANPLPSFPIPELRLSPT
ncbi:hypothetical protein ACJ72_03074, partial [Emergomyces africanus]